MLGPQQPSRYNDQDQQRHGNKQLALHCASPKMP
jgi:hypothetical protein